MNFNELVMIDCITFAKLRYDSYVWKMKQTEDGKNYLEQAYTLTQTQPDMNKLRRKFCYA